MNQYLFGITVNNGLVQAVKFQPIPAADLPLSGVAPGSYTIPAITVDDKGRVTAASNGSVSGSNIVFDAASNLFIGGGGTSVLGSVGLDLGTDNIGIGTISIDESTFETSRKTLSAVTLGVGNVAVGNGSMGQLTTGNFNTSIGEACLTSLTTGSFNAAIGDYCMSFLTTGNGNMAMGDASFGNLTTGSDNIAVGAGANFNVTTGSRNVCIGGNVSLATANDAIAIGVRAQATNSNLCKIGGTSADGHGNAVGFSWNTAPADGDILAGEIWLYVDDTNGAAGKLKIKGKTADGTVFTGTAAYRDQPNTFTAVQTFAPAARTSGSVSWWVAQTPADLTLNASTESIGMQFGGNASAATVTRQWATGNLTTQRENVFVAPKLDAVAASTFTNVATVAITGAPTTTANVTATNPYALWVQGGTTRLDGQLLIPDGTASLPGIAFQAQTNFGFNRRTAQVMDFSYSGVPMIEFFAGGYGIDGTIVLTSIGTYQWASTTQANTATDTGLKRLAAKVVGVFDGGSGKGWLQQVGRTRLTANVTENAGTLTNLSDLSIPLIAGRKYTGRFVLYAKNSTAAEGIQVDFNGGSATMSNFEAGFAAQPATSGIVLGTVISTSLGTALTATTASTTDCIYVIEITLVCNAAGTFIPRFAEVSHTTGTATAILGSYLWLEDSTN